MTVEDDDRQKGINFYKVVIGLMGIVSAGLLVCGLLAVTKYAREDIIGLPFYIGGFTAGIMMITQMILSMFMFMACFLGMIFAGIGGIGSTGYEDDIAPVVKTLAICIMSGCILVIGINILGMCAICKYGFYFGVHTTSNQRQVINVNPLPASTHSPITNISTATSNAHIRNLETQNRLLQQQLQLQQRLTQQSQFTNPTPPPSYSDVSYPAPAYPGQPRSPPPSYDKII